MAKPDLTNKEYLIHQLIEINTLDLLIILNSWRILYYKFIIRYKSYNNYSNQYEIRISIIRVISFYIDNYAA